jgi:N-acetylglutamate synthase
MKTTLVFRPMTIADYDAVAGLLDGIPGVRLRDADSIEGVARYLDRNPGMSFVAEADAGVAGCLFGGHDGRRGYLNHLAVAPTYRRRGIATRLVSHVLAAIGRDGIEKFNADLLSDNEEGSRFWVALGWQERRDIKRLSFIPGGNPNS